MSSWVFQFYHQQSDFDKKVIIDLLDEIIDFSKKFRELKDKTAKRVRQWKENYLFPICAKEGFHINGITFFTKKFWFNQSLWESLFGESSIYFRRIRYIRYDFLVILSIENIIHQYSLSDEALKELWDNSFEKIFSISNGKASLDVPKFRFYEKGFGIDSNETILLTETTKPLLLLAKEFDWVIEKMGRESLTADLKEGVFLDELNSISYECNTQSLIKLRGQLLDKNWLTIITVCNAVWDKLFLNWTEVKLAEKSWLFLNLIIRYFFKYKSSTEISWDTLIEFYRKNKDDFIRLDQRKLTYINIKNTYIKTLNLYIENNYISKEILIIKKIDSSFIIQQKMEIRC